MTAARCTPMAHRSPVPVLLLLALAAALAAAVAPAIDLPAAQTIDDAPIPAFPGAELQPAVPDMEAAALFRVQEPKVTSYSHSPTKHAAEQGSVRDCLKNAAKRIYRVDNIRYLRVCVDEGRKTVVFQVVDRISGELLEYTAYIRQRMTCWEQVEAYTLRMRYIELPRW